MPKKPRKLIFDTGNISDKRGTFCFYESTALLHWQLIFVLLKLLQQTQIDIVHEIIVLHPLGED